MKNNLAVLAVALFGLWLFLSGFPYFVALFSGYPSALITGVAPLAGLLMFLFRRPVAEWLVGGTSESDDGALALALVRGVGLLLLFTGVGELAQVLLYASVPHSGPTYTPAWWEPMRGAAAAAVMAAGLVLLVRPAGIAGVLDSQPEESPEAVRLQTIAFGAIALWVLITDVPSVLSASYVIWMNDYAQPLYERFDFQQTLGSLIRVAIAFAVFIGRGRLAASWHRIRPMA